MAFLHLTKIICQYSTFQSETCPHHTLRWSIGLHTQELAILEANQRFPFTAKKASKSQEAAVKKILTAQIAVDWAFVAGSAPECDGSPIDILMCQYAMESLIHPPLNIKVKGNKCWFVVASLPVPAVAVLLVPAMLPEQMVVDEPNPAITTAGQALDVQLAKSDAPAHPVKMEVDDPTDLHDVEHLSTMVAFYKALEHIRVLIKDCTQVANNAETVFAPRLFIPATVVIAMLLKTGCVPTRMSLLVHVCGSGSHCKIAPWNLWWCLPGFPWLVGPFACLHHVSEKVQRDHSLTMFCKIPVTGLHNTLRIMVVFRHPEVEHVNQLTSYTHQSEDPNTSSTEDEVDDTKLLLVKAEEDHKLVKTRGHVSTTALKHTQIKDYMFTFLLPDHPWTGELHRTKDEKCHSQALSVHSSVKLQQRTS
ncbi:hypothetical protein C8R44DRAFT_733829 [Mycena epipterygia]|nr:hypothetical protein C8R44DRAFT_733829 [Mycena epipterygia]